MKKIVEEIIQNLNPKERETIIKRYGLRGGEIETLESIGKELGITRERVRQIQNQAIQKIKPIINSHQEIKNFIQKTKQFLEPIGVQEEYYFYHILIKNKLIKAGEEKIIRFFLIHHEDIGYYPGDDFLKSFYAKDKNYSLFLKHILKKIYIHLIENHQKIFSEDELFHLILKEIKIHKIQEKNFESLINLIRIIRHLHKNPFNFWGFIKNYFIVPTSLKHKIYLILKSENRPLHFSEIHKKINQITQIEDEFLHPIWKKPYSLESIKNELIKNSDFVFVGRGTYALKEWGFEEGKIFDVLKNFILKNKEVSFQKVYEFINSQKIVKPSTLSIYLYRMQKQGLINIEGNIIKINKEK